MTDTEPDASDDDIYLSDYLKPDNGDAIGGATGLAGTTAASGAAGYALGEPLLLFGPAVGSAALYVKRRGERYDEGVEAARNSLEHFRGLWNRDEE